MDSKSKRTKIGKLRNRWERVHTAETRLRRNIWQRWQNPNRTTLPVFLVGCGRSGTSMIVHHLGRSWWVNSYNEDNQAAFERWRLRDLSIIESLIAQSYAPVILFKPILDTYKILNLLAKFPAAKAVFVFRHYDDVINSSIKRFGKNNRLNHVRTWIDEDFSEFAAAPPPEKTKTLIKDLWDPSLSPQSGAALYWLFQNNLYFDLGLDQSNDIKLIQYESVASNPVEKFRFICDFLEMPFEPQIAANVFASSVGRYPSPEIDPGIRAACEALWQRLCMHGGTE